MGNFDGILHDFTHHANYSISNLGLFANGFFLGANSNNDTHTYIYIIIYNIDIIHPNCGHPMFKSNWDFDQGNLGWILWMVQQWTPCCTPVKGRFKSQKDREPVSL